MLLAYITYRGADESLARLTSQCILFDGEIFLLMLVFIYT
jgi:hypothetical protein